MGSQGSCQYCYTSFYATSRRKLEHQILAHEEKCDQGPGRYEPKDTKEALDEAWEAFGGRPE